MEGILSPKQEDRLKGLIGIRDCTRTLIQLQHDDTKEYDIEVQQSLLNALYDGFVAKHGRMCAASEGRKEHEPMEEITIKFGRGLVGEPFTRKGTA